MAIDVRIDADKCDGCGLCVDLCPTSVFALRDGRAAVEAVERCIFCGGCVPLCPHRAISLYHDGRLVAPRTGRPASPQTSP